MQNRDPLVPASALFRIAEPLYRKVDGFTDLLGLDELLLDRATVARLCKRVRLTKHNEKWIQIKFRLANDQDGLFVTDEDERDERAQKMVRGPNKAEWPKDYRWRPDFIPSSVVFELKKCLKAVRHSYKEIKQNFEEHVALHPYPRKSILNFDFVIMRLFYMLCPCGAHGTDPSCYVCRFGWMLKSLKTKANIREHIAWWYFLVGHIQQSTLYSSPEIPNSIWRVHPDDELLNDSRNKPKCPLLLQMALPVSPNPDLEPRPLRKREPRYHLQYRPVKRIRTL